MYRFPIGSSGIDFAPYDFENIGYIPPPAPSLNGGLYTGEPFAKNAPWGNKPVTADVTAYTNENLRGANPPPGAINQYPGQVRPGNNVQAMPGVNQYNPDANAVQCTIKPVDPKLSQCSYGKYAMWQ